MRGSPIVLAYSEEKEKIVKGGDTMPRRKRYGKQIFGVLLKVSEKAFLARVRGREIWFPSSACWYKDIIKPNSKQLKILITMPDNIWYSRGLGDPPHKKTKSRVNVKFKN